MLHRNSRGVGLILMAQTHDKFGFVTTTRYLPNAEARCTVNA